MATKKTTPRGPSAAKEMKSSDKILGPKLKAGNERAKATSRAMHSEIRERANARAAKMDSIAKAKTDKIAAAQKEGRDKLNARAAKNDSIAKARSAKVAEAKAKYQAQFKKK